MMARRPQPPPSRRGYGPAHRKLRAQIKRDVVDTGRAKCARCYEPIMPWEPWDLGHADHPWAKRLGLYIGPEHRSCSRRKAPRAPRRRAQALSFFDV